MGVDKGAKVGFEEIRLGFWLDTDAEAGVVETLVRLTERYCVVLQTICQKPRVSVVSGKLKGGDGD